MYNTADQDNGSFRVRFLTDKLLFESQTAEEISNMMDLRANWAAAQQHCSAARILHVSGPGHLRCRWHA
jgi:hypothetical protein